MDELEWRVATRNMSCRRSSAQDKDGNGAARVAHERDEPLPDVDETVPMTLIRLTLTHFTLVGLALALSGATAAKAASHHHHFRRHAGVHRSGPRPLEGVPSRYDDSIYGGASYGYFTSPIYGRFQTY